MKNFTKKIIFILIVLGFLTIAFEVWALQVNWPDSPLGTPLTDKSNLTDLVKYFYEWGIFLGGLAVFIAFLIAGFQYLTSIGNPTLMKESWDRIKSALFGLILLLSSWLILHTINPELTRLEPLSFDKNFLIVDEGIDLDLMAAMETCDKIVLGIRDTAIEKVLLPGECVNFDPGYTKFSSKAYLGGQIVTNCAGTLTLFGKKDCRDTITTFGHTNTILFLDREANSARFGVPDPKEVHGRCCHANRPTQICKFDFKTMSCTDECSDCPTAKQAGHISVCVGDARGARCIETPSVVEKELGPKPPDKIYCKLVRERSKSDEICTRTYIADPGTNTWIPTTVCKPCPTTTKNNIVAGGGCNRENALCCGVNVLGQKIRNCTAGIRP